MEEYVGFGEGEAVGMGCVGERARSSGVGVGDDEKAGTDGFWGHDGGSEGVSKEGNVRGGRRTCLVTCCPWSVESRRSFLHLALVEQRALLLEMISVPSETYRATVDLGDGCAKEGDLPLQLQPDYLLIKNLEKSGFFQRKEYKSQLLLYRQMLLNLQRNG